MFFSDGKDLSKTNSSQGACLMRSNNTDAEMLLILNELLEQMIGIF